MKKTAVLLTCLVMGCSSIQHNIKTWDTKDTLMQASCAALVAVDTVQTANNAKANWKGYDETNLVMGRHPHQDTVYGYMAGIFIAHTVLAVIMPQSWRVYWQVGACIAPESYATTSNERTRRNVK
jgi:hypothetical protein